MFVHFLTAGGCIGLVGLVGYVSLKFDSSPQYAISFCMSTYSPFLTTLPSDVIKTWKITKFAGPSPRITVHCNEVEVLDFIISDQTCTDSSWSDQWSKEVELIQFEHFYDTASDYYRPTPGKYIEYTLYNTCNYVTLLTKIFQCSILCVTYNIDQ